jgi:hypothetical protein
VRQAQQVTAMYINTSHFILKVFGNTHPSHNNKPKTHDFKEVITFRIFVEETTTNSNPFFHAKWHSNPRILYSPDFVEKRNV